MMILYIIMLNALTLACQGFSIHPTSYTTRLKPSTRLQSSLMNSTSVTETQKIGHSQQDFPPATMTRKLDYNELQKIIDVSRPYYKLENEFQVDVPEAIATNVPPTTTMPLGFSCTVDPEMSIGREQGSPISFAEAGRHMAIAGSVAAALNQPPDKSGKLYYLAMDCHLQALSKSTSMHNSLKAQIPVGMKSDSIVILAVCCELTNRKAVCEIMMQFPEDYGVEPYYLRVSYTMLTPKVMNKFYPPPHSLEQVEKYHSVSSKEREGNSHLLSHQQDIPVSPYAQFRGLPSDSFETLFLSSSFINMRNSSIKKVTAASCQGHFDGNPALPVAFLAAFCADLSGKAIGTLTTKFISFEEECTAPGNKKDTDNVLKFISCKVDAHKLVQANTHGISLSCEVAEEPSGVYSSDVSIVALAPPGEEGYLIAKIGIKYELLA